MPSCASQHVRDYMVMVGKNTDHMPNQAVIVLVAISTVEVHGRHQSDSPMHEHPSRARMQEVICTLVAKQRPTKRGGLARAM